MGAYDNPAILKNRMEGAAKSIMQFNQAAASSQQNMIKLLQRRKDKAELEQKRAKDKTERLTGPGARKFESEYAALELSLNDFGLNKAGENVGEANIDSESIDIGGVSVQADSIMENSTNIRNQMLAEMDNPDLTNAEILGIQSKYMGMLTQFKKDVDFLAAGYRQYVDIKENNLQPGDEGYPTGGGAFSQMVDVYKDMYEGNGNIGIYPDLNKDGKMTGRFSIAQFEKDPNTNKYSAANANIDDVTNLTTYRKEGTGGTPGKPTYNFFEVAEEYDPAGGGKKTIDGMMNLYKNSDDYNFTTMQQREQIKTDAQGKPIINPTTNKPEIMMHSVYNKSLDKKEWVPKTKAVESFDPVKFNAFALTDEGSKAILGTLGNQSPASVYNNLTGAMYDPTTDEDALVQLLAENLKKSYIQ